MSRHFAESYKQLSEILGNRISLSDNSSVTTNDAAAADFMEQDQAHISERTDLTLEEKKHMLNKLFLKSVSSGNVDKVNEFLKNPLIDIDGKDEDNTTALIYAACFGKFEIAQALLLAGAKLDNQDSHGWTALMWATTNNHESLVKLLLENGASAQTKSAKGRTVFDFVKNDSQKIADILYNPRDSISSTSSIMGYHADNRSSTSSNAGDCDRYYQYSTEENYESFLSHDNECRPKLIEEFLNYDKDTAAEEEEHGPYGQEYDDDDEDDEEEQDKEIEFNWDRCMPDQMFVFAADDLPYILDTVITKLTLPVRNVQEIFLPANVVFLSARFAHYFSSSELAEDVMEGALYRISNTIKSNTQNVHILSYWMTNMTRLLYYLKKDAELVVATAEYQLRLSELVSETYNYMVNDIGKRITQILEPAMLEHDPISGLENVNFVDDWQRFFRRSTSSRKSEDGAMQMQRSNTNSSTMTAATTNELPTRVISPKTITQLFSSTFYVLQSYEVHSTIIIQALAQFFHFLSCELFNHILSKKKYLCRSKAVQVRMNLSALEEWIRHNHLPPSLISYLNPSIQLVQLLQCVSQLDTPASFQSTVKMFDTINPLQIKRCVTNYRYETNEQRIPEEIEKLVNAAVDETIRLKQARQSRSFERRRKSIPEEEEEYKEEINETKDARFMLPFFVPTTAQLSHAGGWSQKERILLVPVIPEDWMDKLDHSDKTSSS
ncbi:DIL domain-containing protein [Mucor lusitanicus]|uniref:DIL domain-containing protein n=1 Tax=Mucor circinelloides f. lusitanicus TaxID=29924 RepID=A0A8H4B949_MUCCL|nr:DIL domain-containing protein [Mucor lusitanicus]